MIAVAAARAALDRLHATHGFPALAVAVSGGGDSVALLRLASEWSRERGVALAAVTVDHGLRQGSAEEAAFVGELCAGLAVPHVTLQWAGWDGRGNLQDAARGARRRLIAGWAREHGVPAVALGHTRDDQAETVLLRLARGSGVDGLAAMSTESEAEGVLWFRPLLAVSRRELRDHLEAIGQRWIEDPSNEDAAFDRIKARDALAALEPLGVDADGLVRTAARMRRARVALRHLAAQAAAAAVRVAAGDVVIDRPALDAFPEETRLRLLSDAVRWVGGSAYRPRVSGLEALLSAGSARTLAGALVTPGPAFLRVAREPQAVTGLTGRPGERWDRWIVTGPGLPGDTVAALGAAVSDCPEWRNTELPRASLAASPAVWRDGRLVAAPLAGLGAGWSARLAPGRDDFTAFLIAR